MSKYQAVFFDLDHTLWDYDTNSSELLTELFYAYELDQASSFGLNYFLDTFIQVNNKLWNNYNKGHIDREEIRSKRFANILKAMGIRNDELALELSDVYIDRCPRKTNVFPYTYEVLDYLKEKYPLFVLTNGFNDVQEIKLSCSKLSPYFQGVITSESSGHRKPSREIFEFALSQAKSSHHNSIMIGDNLSTDIAGAAGINMDTVFFNPHKKPHKAEISFEIDCLSQLMRIL